MKIAHIANQEIAEALYEFLSERLPKDEPQVLQLTTDGEIHYSGEQQIYFLHLAEAWTAGSDNYWANRKVAIVKSYLTLNCAHDLHEHLAVDLIEQLGQNLIKYAKDKKHETQRTD